ncbi:MAG: hypothetical protein ACLPZR_11515 [Solirubrobacteraceae bacterium]
MNDERDDDTDLDADKLDQDVELGAEEPHEPDGEIEFDDSEDDGASALNRLFAADGPADLDEGMFAGPLYWPSIPSADIEQEFRDLRGWVQELLERFEHLDHAIIPGCWWRHNGHVEALQALRDHERMSYAESSPGQAATSWHREFQFIEMRLREWTAFYGCAQEHRAPIRPTRRFDEDAWEAMLAEQKRRREDGELGA